MTLNLKSILIINREPDLASLYAEMLLMDVEKFIINTAYTGKDAVLTLAKYLPDLILLDINLDDMDGWDLVREIKMSGPDIPVIIITERPPDINDISRLSMVWDYMIKPVSLDSLLMSAKDALEVSEILKRCMDEVKNSPNRELLIRGVEENIKLIKRSIIDRKIFIIMKQMYPGDRNRKAGILLNNLKEKIDRTNIEIETIKNRECLLKEIIF